MEGIGGCRWGQVSTGLHVDLAMNVVIKHRLCMDLAWNMVLLPLSASREPQQPLTINDLDPTAVKPCRPMIQFRWRSF